MLLILSTMFHFVFKPLLERYRGLCHTEKDTYIRPAVVYVRVHLGLGVNNQAVSLMCIPVCVSMLVCLCVHLRMCASACMCVNNSLLAVIADEGCVSRERALNAPRQPV